MNKENEMAQDDNIQRWGAFSQEELATIALSLASAALVEYMMADKESSPKLMLEVSTLMNEVMAYMGEGDGIDPELMEKLKELVASAGS